MPASAVGWQPNAAQAAQPMTSRRVPMHRHTYNRRNEERRTSRRRRQPRHSANAAESARFPALRHRTGRRALPRHPHCLLNCRCRPAQRAP